MSEQRPNFEPVAIESLETQPLRTPPSQSGFLPRPVLYLLVAGAALRLIAFAFAKNNGGDALARAEITAVWLQHPFFRLNFEPWLPFHFWLMAAMSDLVRSPALGTRLLSLVLGIASLLAFWHAAKEIYGDMAAVLSLAVFTLYSLQIAYSTTSSSEVPYLFFVLVGIWLFFAARRRRSILELCMAGLALGVAAGIRYEAWVCIFALSLALFFFPAGLSTRENPRRLAQIVAFCGTAGLWPVFWMVYQWKVFSKPLYGVTMNYGWVPQQMAVMNRSLLYRLALPPGVLLITLTPLVLAASLLGLWLGLRHNRGRQFFLLVLVSAAAFVFQIAHGGLLPLARYTITIGTFAAIASGYGFEQFARSASLLRRFHWRLALVAFLALNLASIAILAAVPTRFADKFASISPVLRFPQHIAQLGEYLKPRVNATDRFVIDDYNVESNIVAAAIGLPLFNRDRAFLASEMPIAQLSAYMSAQRPDYLIYSDRGVLDRVLPLNGSCQNTPVELNGMRFSCVFANGIYRIYKIKYRDAAGMLATR